MIGTGRVYQFGFIPDFIVDEGLPVIPQLHRNYGGGWNEFEGFKCHELDNVGGAYLSYPGDPNQYEVARLILISGEHVILFPYSWVCVWTAGQPFDTAKIARMD